MKAIHGHTRVLLSAIYHNMLARCYKPICQNFHNYGARGITVCEEWKNSKDTFIEWAVNNGYEKGLSLDRIDNDKGYSPENCRWTTSIIQNNNRRTNHRITINGETHTISEWARITGIWKTTIRERVKKGWKEEDLLLKPDKGRRVYGMCSQTEGQQQILQEK